MTPWQSPAAGEDETQLPVYGETVGAELEMTYAVPDLLFPNIAYILLPLFAQ